MNRLLSAGLLLTALLLLRMTSAAEPPLRLLRLPPIPDREGFAGGFAGVSGDRLLFAGGANFPDKKPWEGGRKIWSAAVFALPLDAVRAAAAADGSEAAISFQWRNIGQLAQPLGYGVSATFGDELICVGGSREGEHSAEVLGIRFVTDQLQQRTLPPLPHPLANHSGARIGSHLYVLGGQRDANGLAEAMVWSLHLENLEAGWQEATAFPGRPRILAAAGAVDGQLLIAGGAALVQDAAGKLVREYLSDAWTLDPQAGWSRLPDVPFPSVAAPSPIPLFNQRPLLLGGDDGRQVGQDPARHRGFPKHSALLVKPQNRWQPGPIFLPAVVTAPVVQTPFAAVIISGETRPGIRSPAVWGLTAD